VPGALFREALYPCARDHPRFGVQCSMSETSRRSTAFPVDPPEGTQTGDDRDRTAEGRDQRAEARDQASQGRDERADTRDERADVREKAAHAINTGAGDDRAGALRDRRGGAGDRLRAADDRQAAAADRVLSARERVATSIDELTRAYRREPGTVALEREIARAKRTQQPFTLAFVDVDNLKGTNDSQGHAAGDKLLRAAVTAIRARFRSYDLIVRFGGDEFLCGLLDLTADEVNTRCALVNEDLAGQGASITAGVAQLAGDASLEDLISLADEAMYRERRQRPPQRRRFRVAPSRPGAASPPLPNERPRLAPRAQAGTPRPVAERLIARRGRA
jgi:diguanylate cyclase (GGDEF)-like protein